MLSRSEEINCRIPCKETILEVYSSANWAVVIDSLIGKKWATFVSLSMTTKIASFPCLALGNPVTKSILIWSNFHSEIARGWRRPAGRWCSAFNLQHTSHSFTNWAISRFIWVHQYDCLKSWYNFELPRWIERRELCASFIMTFLRSPLGTTIRPRRIKCLCHQCVSTCIWVSPWQYRVSPSSPWCQGVVPHEFGLSKLEWLEGWQDTTRNMSTCDHHYWSLKGNCFSFATFLWPK